MNYRRALEGEIARTIATIAEVAPLVWLALVMAEPSGALTVNLRAPIVINPRTMLGQQVLPLKSVYPLRHVLLEAESCEAPRANER